MLTQETLTIKSFPSVTFLKSRNIKEPFSSSVYKFLKFLYVNVAISVCICCKIIVIPFKDSIIIAAVEPSSVETTVTVRGQKDLKITLKILFVCASSQSRARVSLESTNFIEKFEVTPTRRLPGQLD